MLALRYIFQRLGCSRNWRLIEHIQTYSNNHKNIYYALNILMLDYYTINIVVIKYVVSVSNPTYSIQKATIPIKSSSKLHTISELSVQPFSIYRYKKADDFELEKMLVV